VSGSERLGAHRDAVTDFEYVERVPRQRAAEHLVDIAYALTGGETLELRHDGEQVTVAVADEVLMIRRSTSKGDRVEVSIELSWSSPDCVDLPSRE
jgi:amphi-Trp domain-containing protein